MVKYANKYEYDNFRDFELKIITPLDALEFAKAQNESFQQLSNYFNQDYFSKPRSFIEIFDSLMLTIRSPEVELYGLYDGRRLLGVGVYQYISYSDNGCEIVIWMRASEEGKKIGTYLLKKLTLLAFSEKNFRFVELLIDESNLASRKIASNIGYEHIETFAGIDKTDSSKWITVSYLPGFFGYTPMGKTANNDFGSYPGNQNSYGMWLTPPKSGTGPRHNLRTPMPRPIQ
jgi:RimJ/RimL family protein N-acetyltransferase